MTNAKHAPYDTRLQQLRHWLKQEKLDAFIQPVNDEFQGEYIPDCDKRLTWLTNFSGSAGAAVVCAEEKQRSAMMVDGRYTLQAAAEVNAEYYEVMNIAETPMEQWVTKQVKEGGVVAFNPWLHTHNQVERWRRVLSKKHIALRALQADPIAVLWKERPAFPTAPARIQPDLLTGESSSTKRSRLASELKEAGCDAVLLTLPDSICWLLNIRGSDVPFTPFLLAYAIAHKDGKVTLYVDTKKITPDVKAHLGAGIEIKEKKELQKDIQLLGKQKSRLRFDPASGSEALFAMLQTAGCEVVKAEDPCQLPKACKNKVELEGVRQAHRRDGLALSKFLSWFDSEIHKGSGLTEMQVAEKLLQFRQESNLFQEPSFATIAGFGSNGAIVHYRAVEETDKRLEKGSLMLLDSGGQYQDGTTDVTRTMAVGMPTPEMRDRFTRVLKGHIKLAMAKFPEGTSGQQLDALARYPLWQAGLDYDHGTGHGVGSFLSVHEGPQRISKRMGDTPLKPGMILSNEPGYYKTGEYGIRIENLVTVVEADPSPDGRRFFCFETLTLAPIDLNVVEPSLLSAEEKLWLNAYHKRVYETHAKDLEPATEAWLRQATRAIE